MVLVAIMIFVLMGIAGVAIDYARLYAFKTQLQTSTDAAAMAGAVELVKGRNSNLQVYGAASSVGSANLVEQQTANISPRCIEWNISTAQRVFPDPPDCTDTRVNAVRVEGDYAAQYSLSRIFGAQGVTLPAFAIAARGYVGGTNCIRPWAVSYQTVLDVLFGPNAKTPSYNLTAADVAALTAMRAPQNSVTLLQGNQNPVTPGNVAQVVVDTRNAGNSNNPGGYRWTINNCANMMIGPGTWLDTDPGGGGGQTANALQTFCANNGGAVGNQNHFTCPGEPKVKLSMWDINNGQSGNNLQYRVKYVGVFAITGFDKQGQTEQINGYFSSMASDGSFSSTPSPLTKAILVQ
jgi:hypothetical protein